MKKLLILFCPLWLLAFSLQAQIQRNYTLIGPGSIESKNYYFTFLLGHFAEVDSLLNTDSALQQMATQKQEHLVQASTTEERIKAFQFSEEEIRLIGERLIALCQKGNPLEQLVTFHPPLWRKSTPLPYFL